MPIPPRGRCAVPCAAHNLSGLLTGHPCPNSKARLPASPATRPIQQIAPLLSRTEGKMLLINPPLALSSPKGGRDFSIPLVNGFALCGLFFA